MRERQPGARVIRTGITGRQRKSCIDAEIVPLEIDMDLTHGRIRIAVHIVLARIWLHEVQMLRVDELDCVVTGRYVETIVPVGVADGLGYQAPGPIQ